MGSFDVTMKGHYEKTVTITGESLEEAVANLHILLANPDLIGFSNEDFSYGEVSFADESEDEDECLEHEDCLDCPYYCPLYRECRYEDECEG